MTVKWDCADYFLSILSLPSATVVAERLCFHKRRPFCPQGEVSPLGRHPPGQADTSLGRQTPPWVDTPWPGRHLPGQADTPLGRHPLTRQTPPCSDTPLGRPPWSGRHPPGQADTPLDRPPSQAEPPAPQWADCHCSGWYASY